MKDNMWKVSVSVRDLHTSRREGRISVAKCAEVLASRLSRIKVYKDDLEFQDIIEYFQDLAGIEEPDISEYDNVLASLYDWGDYGRRLWVG